MSHHLSRLLNVFLILVIVAPMLAACGGDEPTTAPVASATPAPSRTPLPVADAKGAKATSLPQTRAYTSPDLGFSVDYPSDWQVDARNAADEGVLFYRPDTETAFCAAAAFRWERGQGEPGRHRLPQRNQHGVGHQGRTTATV